MNCHNTKAFLKSGFLRMTLVRVIGGRTGALLIICLANGDDKKSLMTRCNLVTRCNISTSRLCSASCSGSVGSEPTISKLQNTRVLPIKKLPFAVSSKMWSLTYDILIASRRRVTKFDKFLSNV